MFFWCLFGGLVLKRVLKRDQASGSAKDSLMRWCKFNTNGFNGVDVTNLTKSWHNGLALSCGSFDIIFRPSH